MATGIIKFSFSSLCNHPAVAEPLSRKNQGLCRAAGNFVNSGFTFEQLDAIRQQFASIVFYKVDQWTHSSKPLQAYADKGTLRVFTPKIFQEDVLLKHVLSALMVIALRKSSTDGEDQKSAVTGVTDEFLMALRRKDLQIPQDAFPGLSIRDGIIVFQEVVYQIAQHQANTCFYIVESADWKEASWTPAKLESLIQSAWWKYSDEPPFKDLQLKKQILKFQTPVFQTDQFSKESSPIVHSLQAILRAKAVGALF